MAVPNGHTRKLPSSGSLSSACSDADSHDGPQVRHIASMSRPRVDSYMTQSSLPGYSDPGPISRYSTAHETKATAPERVQKAQAKRSSTWESNAATAQVALPGKEVSFAEDDEEQTAETKCLAVSKPHEILFVGVAIMSNFMALAGLGQAISPLQIISNDLHVTKPGEQAWFAAAYSLTVGTFILMAGRMGDVIGHKRMFVCGYCFLGVWSGFAGFTVYTGRQIFFDVCRALQGIGAAMVAPNALALLARAYPPGKKKNIIFSLYGAMAPWGFVVGALFGAIFAELAWWPWIFWSYGLAAWALAAFALLVVPKSLGHDAQFVAKTAKPGMDWKGCGLGVTGLVLVNVAWNNAALYGWHTPHVYFVLIIGLLVLVTFGWVESHAESPLVPVKAMNRTVVWTLALVGLGWGSFGIWIYYSFRWMMEVRGSAPLLAAVRFIPAIPCGMIAAGVTGLMLTHTPVAFTVLISMTAFFVGELIAATQPVKQSFWAQMFISVLIMPFGMDMSFPAATIILSNNMPPEHQGLAASLVNTVVNYSISIALGIAGTVEMSVSNHDLLPVAKAAWSIRCAYYAALTLSGSGLLLGIIFFGVTLKKEGWKISKA